VGAAELTHREIFAQGQRAMLPFVPGVFAWGMVSGVAMVKGGLSVPWALAMSLLVNAASAQLAALPLIVAGAPLWVIVGTGLITNLRFVIYSAAIRPYFAGQSLGRRTFLGFFMTDFTFLRFMRSAQDGSLPATRPDTWFAGMISVNILTWHVAATTGIIGASYVPTEWGLEFTGTLALLALIGPTLNAAPAVIGAVTAAVIAVLTHGLPYKLGLFCGAMAGIVAATAMDLLRGSPREDRPA
jgi:predicted branched-subunit amino acid permease